MRLCPSPLPPMDQSMGERRGRAQQWERKDYGGFYASTNIWSEWNIHKSWFLEDFLEPNLDFWGVFKEFGSLEKFFVFLILIFRWILEKSVFVLFNLMPQRLEFFMNLGFSYLKSWEEIHFWYIWWIKGLRKYFEVEIFDFWGFFEAWFR